MNQKEYDAKQTELLDKLRERFQSIATMAVEVQDKIGNIDIVFDVLNDIERDMKAAADFAASLECLKK